MELLHFSQESGKVLQTEKEYRNDDRQLTVVPILKGKHWPTVG